MRGERFGRLIVLHVIGIEHRVSWVYCRCDCGTEKNVRAADLVSGKVKSCGCLRREVVSAKHLLDMTGQRIGAWIVLRRADIALHSGAVFWLCQCICGVQSMIRGVTLRKGYRQSCRHDRVERLKDLTGQSFNGLRAISYYGDGRWECLCYCGNLCIVSVHDFQQNRYISCGCARRLSVSRTDLAGSQYGYWKVLREAPRKGKKRYWHCCCICGTERTVQQGSLTGGHTMHCGCQRQSPQETICILGARYGRLVLQSLPYHTPSGRKMVSCRCDCGITREIDVGNLMRGNTTSCGCAAKDAARLSHQRNRYKVQQTVVSFAEKL